MCNVKVLFDGYSETLDNGTMRANCSCTLIKGSKLIIVDTMTAWDEERIIQALQNENVTPQSIDYVVCTHSHPDHIGNNNLFKNAEHIVGITAHRGNIFWEWNCNKEEYILCKGVKLITTPGHTPEDVTVLVESSLNGKPTRLAITGDLFEKEDDILDSSIWKKLGQPSLQKLQSRMRSRVVHLADFIIPGHGPMFAVTDDVRQIIDSQIIE